MTPEERVARELIRILTENHPPESLSADEYTSLLFCGAACIEVLLGDDELPPSLRIYSERRDLLAERITEILEIAERRRAHFRAKESEQKNG